MRGQGSCEPTDNAGDRSALYTRYRWVKARSFNRLWPVSFLVYVFVQYIYYTLSSLKTGYTSDVYSPPGFPATIMHAGDSRKIGYICCWRRPFTPVTFGYGAREAETKAKETRQKQISEQKRRAYSTSPHRLESGRVFTCRTLPRSIFGCRFWHVFSPYVS